MTGIRFHPAARIELDEARRYYRKSNPGSAKRFSSEMLQLLERIADHPPQFPEWGLIAVPAHAQTLFFSVRRAVLPRIFPYGVFYYLREGQAVILAVAHDKRRPGYWAHRS